MRHVPLDDLAPMTRLLAVWLLCLSLPVLADAPAATRTLVLVRHGHYAADPSIDPALGPGLSALGVAQSRLVGGRLAGEARFDRIYASPMTRAAETAAVIAEDLGGEQVETLDGLAECIPPTRRSEVTTGMAEEDLKACAERFDALFDTWFRAPAEGSDRLLLVCHGNVIRYLLTRALDVDPEAWLEFSIGHVSISTIRIEPDGRRRVLGAGDLGHLPPNLRSGASGDVERGLRVGQ